ncbi:MAG: IS4 family transposase [Planctomycetota bacterium]
MQVAADPKWHWRGLHAKLVDGFTFTMLDTIMNQNEFPQLPGQKPGCGFPIARAVTIVSLATACVIDLAIAPYRGKQTGESALLRTLLSNFGKGDVAVMDRYYCSYMMLAMLLGQGSQVCARKHHLRPSGFRRGRRLGKYDHLIVWTRPPRPKWMDRDTYASVDRHLILREIRYWIVEKGRRTKSITIITTLLDHEAYDKESIAELYGFRWNSETDIHHIKTSLNLNHVRCKSPAMVRRDLWTTVLAYNLIRTSACAAAYEHEKLPRQISFTSTCQYVLAMWMLIASGKLAGDDLLAQMECMLEQLADCEVANRPGRLEPRVRKRRPKNYPLMQQSRAKLRAKLRKRST